MFNGPFLGLLGWAGTRKWNQKPRVFSPTAVKYFAESIVPWRGTSALIIVHLSSTGASKSACLTALKSLTRKGKQLLSAIFFVCVFWHFYFLIAPVHTIMSVSHVWFFHSTLLILCSAIPLQPLLQLQPFNCLFSRTTWVSRYQKGKTNLDFTEARDSEW